MKTHILFFVEGDTEDALFPMIIQYYRRNFHCRQIDFHTVNVKGVGNYKGKAKGKLQQLLRDIKKDETVNKEINELKVVICSYDTDAFEFSRTPPIDWKQLKKEFENITGKKNVELIPIKSSIEDWLLSDIEGLCQYLKIKKVPRRLYGHTGYDKISHWFKQYNKSYYKGYDCKNIVSKLDIAKIATVHKEELMPIWKALGIKKL